MSNATFSKYILPLGFLLIAGCGGGGGGSGFSGDTDAGGAPSAPDSSTTTPSTPSDSGSTTPPVDEDSAGLSQKTGPCADTYEAGFALIEGKDTTQPKSGFGKPAKGVPYNDPAYDSCVVRATDADAEGLTIFARNDYSRRQPFNADDSLFLAYTRGSETWHLYDTETLDYVRHIDLGGKLVEPQWHPVHPDIIHVFPDGGGMTIREINIADGSNKVVADFGNVQEIAGRPGDTSIKDIWSNAARVSTRSEGSPSADARYWGLLVMDSSGDGLGMITYDMLSDTITGVYDFATDGGGVGMPDHISMSPSGEYVVPSWATTCSGGVGSLNKPCGLMSFKRDFSYATGLSARTSHSDTGIDANGNDVIVAADYNSGWVEMWNLATGENSKLWEIYENGNSTAMHVSARNFNKPGWVLISTYHEKSSPGWYVRKIMAVEMNSNPRILNIAHTYNQGGGYFSEPHAAVNRDFTKIMFNSNWNSGSDDNVDTYMIELPENAVPAR